MECILAANLCCWKRVCQRREDLSLCWAMMRIFQERKRRKCSSGLNRMSTSVKGRDKHIKLSEQTSTVLHVLSIFFSIDSLILKFELYQRNKIFSSYFSEFDIRFNRK